MSKPFFLRLRRHSSIPIKNEPYAYWVRGRFDGAVVDTNSSSCVALVAKVPNDTIFYDVGTVAYDRSIGVPMFFFTGDIKALKRHNPAAYAAAKAAGKIGKKAGRKWVCHT